tara:strand:+ start:506 stop:1534 length:1029 start_codon:yes stop_codon:yes gene_type:complete
MDDKVIIVKRKKKKPKDKRKKKTKAKSTMEQKVSQNVKVIINERAKPRRNRALAVKGFNTPRLSIQPPTIIHKGLDAENALNNFRNIYDVRVRALERGLNGVNGNITNLTSQTQNNRPPPLSAPVPSSNTSIMSDDEGQRILDERLAKRLQQEQEAQKRQIEKDYYNTNAGEQDGIYFNFINKDVDPRQAEDFYGSQSNPNLDLPVAESRFDPSVPEAVAEEKVEKVEAEKVVIKRKKFTREEREQRREERAQIRGVKSLEYTEQEIRDADENILSGMIVSLDKDEGYKFIDGISGGVKRGQLTQAKAFVRNAVKENRKKRQAKEQAYKGGRNLDTNLNRNL